jgi:hypothetical protein
MAIASETTKGDFSQIVKPDWNNAQIYSRLGSDVIELPLDPAVKLGFTFQHVTADQFSFNQNFSRTSFLIIGNKSNYKAYLMTIVADSSYLNGNINKLDALSYKNIDRAFSGYVIYFLPDGKLVNGYKYTNGSVIKTISINTNSNSLQIQSTHGIKITDSGCSTSSFLVFTGVSCISVSSATYCTYYYDLYTVTICDDQSFNHDDGNDGGALPPASSGSGTSITSVIQQQQILEDSLKKHFPCASKLIVDSLSKIQAYADFVAPFATNIKPDLIWQDGALPWNTPVPNSTNVTNYLGQTSSNGRSSTITLNTNMLQQSSQLLIAATAIHETLHAYINYLVETNVNFSPPALYNSSQSWLVSLDYWVLMYGLPTNYRDHYDMLSDYFSKAVEILKAWDHNGHTDKEYQMAMLYGLDTNDFLALPAGSPGSLSVEYNNILTKYQITPADLDAFWRSQLNSTNNKLPTGCPIP